MLGHERIVVQMRIQLVYAGDLVGLPRTERFGRIETPDAFKQPLAAKDFVNSRNAAGLVVGSVEESGVAIGDLGSEGEQRCRNGLLCPDVLALL